MGEDRYVGILFNKSLYSRIPSGKTGHESLRLYEQAGKIHGVTPCFICLENIRPGLKRVAAYVRENHGYRRRLIPAPSVIHNRALHLKSSARRKLDALTQAGHTLFNGQNRYGKWSIHQILSGSDEIRPYLPETLLADPKSIKYMMRKYDALILKPNNSSIGRGIMKLEHKSGRWELTYLAGGPRSSWRVLVWRGSLPSLLRHKISMRPYIVQEWVPLAVYSGSPFDLRVSVQRNETGDWQIAGMAAKVAKPGMFLTNVAQGGTAHPLEKVLQVFPDGEHAAIVQRVSELALQVGQYLGSRLHNLADLGLDIAITNQGRPMFIECNCRDLRIIFDKSRQYDKWLDTYANPLGFARYLLDRQKSE